MPQSPMNSLASGLMAERMQLEWPASVGVFERYTQAQAAVDHLADHDFPVENVMIVGTDLRQVERVTGRMSQQRVAAGGLASGLWMGLFVGLIFSMFDQQGWRTIVTTVLFGALFGLVWALIGHALTRGRRDFTSVSQVVATKYEVLVEHQLQAQAREMLRVAGLLGPQGGAGVVGRPSAGWGPAAPDDQPRTRGDVPQEPTGGRPVGPSDGRPAAPTGGRPAAPAGGRPAGPTDGRAAGPTGDERTASPRPTGAPDLPPPTGRPYDLPAPGDEADRTQRITGQEPTQVIRRDGGAAPYDQQGDQDRYDGRHGATRADD